MHALFCSSSVQPSLVNGAHVEPAPTGWLLGQQQNCVMIMLMTSRHLIVYSNIRQTLGEANLACPWRCRRHPDVQSSTSTYIAHWGQRTRVSTMSSTTYSINIGGNCISSSKTSPTASWLHQPAPSTLGVNTHVFTGSSMTSRHRAFYTNTSHRHWGQRTLCADDVADDNSAFNHLLRHKK